MSHTPGPWKYATNVGPTKALIVEEDGSTILDLYTTVGKRSDLEDNARLISSAPDMLRALQMIAHAKAGVFDFAAMQIIARKAIAKATGQ